MRPRSPLLPCFGILAALCGITCGSNPTPLSVNKTPPRAATPPATSSAQAPATTEASAPIKGPFYFPVANDKEAPTHTIAWLDQRTIVAGLGGGGLRLWDVPTESLRESATLFGDRIFFFAANDKIVLHKYGAWNLATNKHHRAPRDWGTIHDVVVSPKGDLGALIHDRTIRLVSLPEWSEVRSIKHGDYASPASTFTPDGTGIVIAYQNDSIHVFDVASGKERFAFDNDVRGYTGLLFTASGELVVMPGIKGERLITVADMNSKKAIRSVTMSYVMRPSVATGGRLIAWGDRSTTCEVFDTTTMKVVHSIPNPLEKTCALSPDGKLLAIATIDRLKRSGIRILRVEDGAEVALLGPKMGTATMTNVDAAADGSVVLIARSDGKIAVSTELVHAIKLGAGIHAPLSGGKFVTAEGTTLSICDAKNGACNSTGITLPKTPRTMTADSRGERLAMWFEGNRIMLVDIAAKTTVDAGHLQLRSERSDKVSFLFSDDSSTLAVWLAGEKESLVRLVDGATGKVRKEMREKLPVLSAAFDAQGRYFAYGATDYFTMASTATVLDKEDNYDERSRFPIRSADTIRLSRDGSELATSERLSNYSFYYENLYFTRTGVEWKQEPSAWPVIPAGSDIAFAAQGRDVMVWGANVKTPAVIRIMDGAAGGVVAAAFTPDAGVEGDMEAMMKMPLCRGPSRTNGPCGFASEMGPEAVQPGALGRYVASLRGGTSE